MLNRAGIRAQKNRRGGLPQKSGARTRRSWYLCTRQTNSLHQSHELLLALDHGDVGLGHLLDLHVAALGQLGQQLGDVFLTALQLQLDLAEIMLPGLDRQAVLVGMRGSGGERRTRGSPLWPRSEPGKSPKGVST